MMYPFADPVSTFKDSIKPLSDLAHSDTPFDSNFPTRLPDAKAYSFDEIKDCVCRYRSIGARQKLRSADAFLIGDTDSNPWYYLIEFKNQKADNIQSVKDEDNNELMQKAFDSLSILSMTFGHAMSMQYLQQHSSFIVVYPQQDYTARFTETLNQCGQPLWKLDKLINAGFYAEIETIHDGVFATMHLPYVV